MLTVDGIEKSNGTGFLQIAAFIVLVDKPVPMPLYPPHIPLGLLMQWAPDSVLS